VGGAGGVVGDAGGGGGPGTVFRATHRLLLKATFCSAQTKLNSLP